MDDTDLLARLAADLDGGFERLALAYQHRLYAFALRLTGQREDAEEIAQDTLVRAYRALGRYPAERVRGLALRAWLFQIALNVARNHARVHRPLLVSLDGEEGRGAPEPSAAAEERPEALVERAEHRQELVALVLALPERYRVAVVLRHVEGLGYREIGAVLGQPVGTVKANVHRGVRLLREAMSQRLSEVG